ncbi:hypothetical protein ACLKA7_013197 [Drosophila subpalustris]
MQMEMEMEMSTPAPSEARDEQQATEATVATVATTVAGSSCGKYSDAQREVWYLATTPMAVRPSVCPSVCLCCAAFVNLPAAK